MALIRLQAKDTETSVYLLKNRGTVEVLAFQGTLTWEAKATALPAVVFTASDARDLREPPILASAVLALPTLPLMLVLLLDMGESDCPSTRVVNDESDEEG